MKTIFTLILTVFISLASAEEEKEPSERYWLTEAGWQYAGLRDEPYSPFLFEGHNFAGGTAFLIFHNDYLHSLDLHGSYGQLHPDIPEGPVKPYLTNYSGQAAYAIHRKVWEEPNTGIMVFPGLYLNARFHYNEHSNHTNNAETFLNVSSAGLKSVLKYDFELFGRDFMLLNSTEMPLFSLRMRPAHNFSFPEEFINPVESEYEGWKKSVKPAFVTEYFSFYNQFRFSWFLYSGNALGLTYAWQFGNFNTERSSRKNFEQTLMLSKQFRF